MVSQVLTCRMDDASPEVLESMEGAPKIYDRIAPDGNI